MFVFQPFSRLTDVGLNFSSYTISKLEILINTSKKVSVSLVSWLQITVPCHVNVNTGRMNLAHTSREYSLLEKTNFGKDLLLSNTNLVICYYNEKIQLNKSDNHT